MEPTIARPAEGLVEVAGLESGWENHLHPVPSSPSCRWLGAAITTYSLGCMPSNLQWIFTTTLSSALKRSSILPESRSQTPLGVLFLTCLRWTGWYPPRTLSPVHSNDVAGYSAPCRRGSRPGTQSTAANTETSCPTLAQRAGEPPPRHCLLPSQLDPGPGRTV